MHGHRGSAADTSKRLCLVLPVALSRLPHQSHLGARTIHEYYEMLRALEYSNVLDILVRPTLAAHHSSSCDTVGP